MKKIFLLLMFIASISETGFSQITYLADTAFTTDVGFGGAPASCRAPHMEYNSWQMEKSSDVWVADAFTVPAGATWVFDTVVVYGYQIGSGVSSTFTGGYLMIYNDAPGGLGGSVIWGDTSTNVLVSSGFTGIYRVDTTVADGGLSSTQRPIMYLNLHLSPAPVLTAGTYWLAWSTTGSIAGATDAPDKVLPGRVNPPGQVARQFGGAAWHNISDSGQAIGMDMIIKARAGLESVAAPNSNPTVSLSQNAPNPANSNTLISFYLNGDNYVQLSVFNLMGQVVKTLAQGNRSAGNHQVTLDVSDLPDGIYYYQLKTPAGTEARKMEVVH